MKTTEEKRKQGTYRADRERRQRAEAEQDKAPRREDKIALGDQITELRKLIAKVQSYIIGLPGFKVNNSLLEEE